MRSFLSKALPTMIAALFSAVSVVSAENKVAYDQGYEVDESQLKGIYNSPASIDVESSWDFYATASFIYWLANEQGLDEGQFVKSGSSIPTQIILFPFEYKPGFKVGIGSHFEYDDWNVSAQYTRLSFRKSHYTIVPVVPGFFIRSAWIGVFGFPLFEDLSAHWKLNYNMFDLECSRPFYIGKKLTFTPRAGLRGGWINQTYNLYGLQLLQDVFFEMLNRSNSWLVGAKAGIDSNWTIGGGFRFIGNAAASLLYQRFKAHYVEDFFTASLGPSSPRTLDANVKDRFGLITPNVEAALGMGWGTYLDSNNWHFDISALYEFTYFWNQNIMHRLVGESRYLHSSNFDPCEPGDLMFHGLTLNARVDF